MNYTTTPPCLKPALKQAPKQERQASSGSSSSNSKLSYQEVIIPTLYDEDYGYEYGTGPGDYLTTVKNIELRLRRYSQSRVKRSSIRSSITIDESLDFDEETTIFNPEEVIELKLMLAELQTQLQIQTDQTIKQKQIATELIASKKDLEEKNSDLAYQLSTLRNEHTEASDELIKLQKENKKLHSQIELKNKSKTKGRMRSNSLPEDVVNRKPPSNLSTCETANPGPGCRRVMGGLFSSFIKVSPDKSFLSQNTEVTFPEDSSIESNIVETEKNNTQDVSSDEHNTKA